MKRDEQNPTYIHTTGTLWSEEGRRFQREKYRPKIDVLRRHFGPRFREMRLLDVGVGYGVFLHMMENEHAAKNLFGMDPFPKSIEIAKQYTTASIFEGDIVDDPWPVGGEPFDAITCFDVVEHLEKPELFFEGAARHLATGGVVLVTTPNRGLPYLMRSIPWFGIPDSNPTHINVRAPSYWRRLAAESGFVVLREWKGEHLTHTRVFPRLFRTLCRLLRLDHRNIPLVNSFEQSFCMALVRAGLPEAAEDPERKGQQAPDN